MVDSDIKCIGNAQQLRKLPGTFQSTLGGRTADLQIIRGSYGELGIDFVQRQTDATEMPAQSPAQIDKAHMQASRCYDRH